MKSFIIETATIETTSFLAIVLTAQAKEFGEIIAARGGVQYIAPLEGRSFSQLNQQQLQYLFWNSKQETPPNDYGQLITELLAFAETLPVSPLRYLPLNNGSTAPVSAPQAPKEPRVTKQPGDRPKAGSTTGLVWDVCDKIYAGFAENGGDWKLVRAAIMAECIKEEINEATAATQYSKWKASKLKVQA